MEEIKMRCQLYFSKIEESKIMIEKIEEDPIFLEYKKSVEILQIQNKELKEYGNKIKELSMCAHQKR